MYFHCSRIVFRNTGCYAKFGVKAYIDLINKDGADAVVGSMCSWGKTYTCC